MSVVVTVMAVLGGLLCPVAIIAVLAMIWEDAPEFFEFFGTLFALACIVAFLYRMTHEWHIVVNS